MSSTKDSFQTFYMQTYNRLYSYLSRMDGVGEAAEDIAQETFCRAYKKWDKLKKYENPMGWLYKTSNHVLWNQRRRKENQNISYEQMTGRETRGYTDSDFNNREWLLTAQKILGEEDWILLEQYIQEYSVAEIARKLGMTEEYVRVRISRIRKLLRMEINGKGPDRK